FALRGVRESHAGHLHRTFLDHDIAGSAPHRRFLHHLVLAEDEARLVEIDGNAGERGKSGKPLAQPAPLLQHDRLWRVKHRPGRLSAGKTDAGRHHRYPDRAVELVVEGRADYDVGVRIGLGPDTARRLVNLVKGDVVASGDWDVP